MPQIAFFIYLFFYLQHNKTIYILACAETLPVAYPGDCIENVVSSELSSSSQ